MAIPRSPHHRVGHVVVTTLCLLGALLIADPARAADPSLGSGNNNLGDVPTSSVIAVNAALGGGSELVATDFPEDRVRVVVTASAGTLSLTSSTGLTAPTGYPQSFAGRDIAFVGTVENANAGLAALRYSAPADAGPATIEVGAAVDGPGVAYNPDNGHYYQFVNTLMSWLEARQTAHAMTYKGMTGYLATITSASENSFVTTKTGGAQSWIGASDAQEEGTWQWVEGPETGQTFWTPACGVGLRGICSTTDRFNNWQDLEPNEWPPSGEDYMQVRAGTTGYWNDNQSEVFALIAEFSTAGGEPNPALSASRTLTVTATAPPGPPTGLSAMSSDRQVALSWTAPASIPPATGYTVQYAAMEGPWLDWPHVGTATAATVTDLTNGTLYRFRVAGVNESGTGVFAHFVEATPSGPPAPPTELTASPSNRQVSLTWVAPASHPALTGYRVEYTNDDGVWTTWPHAGTATTATVTGLTNGRAYQFRVAGINEDGTGPYSETVESTPVGPPEAPAGLELTPGNGKVVASWNAPASDSPITGYVVQYATRTGSWRIWPHGSTSTTATIIGLANGTEYRVRVAAVSAEGTGPYSATATAIPWAPQAPATGLTLTPGNGKVVARWTAPASGAPVTNYVVQYATPSGTWRTWPHGSDKTTATITGLSNGTKYRVRVAAVSAAGTSPYTKIATATPDAPPAPPTGLTLTAGNGKLVARWKAPASGARVTDYLVQYAPATGTWRTWPHGSTGTTATITGLANGTEYRVRVAAVSAMGTGPYSAIASATPKAGSTRRSPTLVPVPSKVGPLTWLQVITNPGRPAASLRSTTRRTCVAIYGRVYFLYPGRCTVVVVQDGKVVRTTHVRIARSAKPSKAKSQRSESVFFAGDSASLTRAAKRTVLKVVPRLRGRDPVMVLGNAANVTGTEDSASARRLARARAGKVADFLRARGVRAIQTVGYSKKFARGLRNPDDRRVDVTWS